MKRIADSTVRRLSLYLRFLEEATARGTATISSDELAKRGSTTSAQVRKDLSFFGSFGKRGLGYSVPELVHSLREILGLGRDWRVLIIGAGKIGSALAGYRGFRSRGFDVIGIYDRSPQKIGTVIEGVTVRDIATLERDVRHDRPDIAILAVPADGAQEAAATLQRAGIRAILNFAPTQLQVSSDVVVRNVNMALELEGLSYALASKERESVA